MISYINNIYHKISKMDMITFMAAFVWGIFTHLFMITNKLYNHDDIAGLYSKQVHQISYGRWFVSYFNYITGWLSIPFNGILAIVYVAFAAVIIVRIFKVKNYICSIIIGCVMITFPTFTCTMTYMNYVDSFSMALLLSCISAYLFIYESKFNSIIGIATLVLSLGLYQSYFPFTISILMCWLIINMLYLRMGWKQVLSKGVRVVFLATISIVVYLIISYIFHVITGIELSANHGMDSIGKNSLLEYWGLIQNAYSHSLAFFLKNEYGINNKILWILYILVPILFFLYSVIFMCVCYSKKKIELLDILLLFMLYAVYPIALGLIYIMSPMYVHMLMIYAYVMYILLPILIIDKFNWVEELFNGKKENFFIRVIEVLTITMGLLTIHNNTIVSNKYYFLQYQACEQAMSYSNRLFSKIESLDGYKKEYPIYLVGKPRIDTSITIPWSKSEPEIKTMTGHASSMVSITRYDAYLHQVIGIESDVIMLKTKEDLEDKDFIQIISEMDCYPNDNAMMVFDDECILVKFEEFER